MEYAIALKKTDDGYSVWVPGLPGCWSQGKTREEAVFNIKDAIALYIEVARELAGSEAEMIEVAIA
ncbi:type II toxin-antitoxin system HicB family antitoxin [bacterium]|nr:type II toxin-antitoxin system HicB family antitoxin [bacterium]